MKKIVFFAIFFGFSLLLHAETRVLTLQDCLAAALQNNADLKIAQQQVEKALGRKKEVRGLLLPQVKVQGMYLANNVTYADALVQDYRSLQQLPAGFSDLFLSVLPPSLRPTYEVKLQEFLGRINLPEELPDRVSLMNASVMVQQPLFTGFKLVNGYKAAAEMKNAAQHSFEVEKTKVQYDVISTFYQAVLLDSLVAVHRMSVEVGEKHLQLIRKMRQEGLASEWELLKARVHVKKLTPKLVQSKKNRDLVYSKLKLLLGLSQKDTISLNGRLQPVALPDSLQAEKLYRTALSHRRELKALSSLIKAGEHAAKIARGEYLPDIGAIGALTFLGMNDQYSLQTRDISQVLSLGVALRWNAFSFGRHSGKVQQARAQINILQEKLMQFKEALNIQIQNVIRSIEYAREELLTQQDAVMLAQKSLIIAQEAFKSGDARQVDVLDAQLDLQSARVEWLNAVFQSIIADLDFKKALGVLTTYQQ